MEAIVPTEITMAMLPTDLPEQSNVETVIKDLDMEDELREATTVRIESYHSRIANLYNKHVKFRMFQQGDLVLRKVFVNTADSLAKKFQPNREASYIVTRAGESGSYALDKLDGTPVLGMWNVMHLKKCYQ